MALSIIKRLPNPPDIYFQQGFFVTLEAHIEYFKQHSTTKVIQLDPLKAHAHIGDLYGMLEEVGVDRQYHWFVMRLNGMSSPQEFDATKLVLYAPDTSLLDRIRTSYNTIGTVTV